MDEVLKKVFELGKEVNKQEKYDVRKDGAVIAIRIYFEGDRNPMADLILAHEHRKVTIDWVNVEQRAEYAPGINGYTLIYDERDKRPFEEWN